jgi:hypothetical protein
MRLLALLTLVWVNASGQPRPLRNTSRPTATHEISILRVEIQDLKPAHGGPSYFTAKRAPFRGQAEVAEASLYGQESIAWVRFELVDEQARMLGVVPAARTGSGVDADGYMLKLDVPHVPFRVRIVGADLGGRGFTNTLKRLFVPMEGTPAAPIPAEMNSMLHAGDLRMARAGITGATYEPLASPNGNPIGLKVRFTVRFDAPGYYDVTPHVWPVYAEYRWRGEIGMHALSIGSRMFEANVDYPLEFDMIPDYMVRRPDGSFCQQPIPRVALFEEIMSSRAPVKYGVAVTSLDFSSETDPLDPARTWLEGFRREGATQCR